LEKVVTAVDMEICEVSRYEWQAYCAGPAFREAFGYDMDPTFDTVDRSLVVLDSERRPLGYVTLREVNRELVQWRFGGAFRRVSKSVHVQTAYDLLIKKCHEQYLFISTLIETENVPSLKLAMHNGFRIVGTQNYMGQVLVELLLDLRKEEKGGH
jgi:hypothetical protein